MNYIPRGPLAIRQMVLATIVSLIGLSTFLVSMGIAVVYSSSFPLYAAFLFAVLAMLGLVVFILALSFADPTAAPYRARYEGFAAEVKGRYGIELNLEEFNGLKYPLSLPTSDFEVFGSIVRNEQLQGSSFLKRSIYLVWSDGKLDLSQSSDGETFVPLTLQTAS